ncbi:MDC1 protein, partial [Pitta sordida]|nr:MDC1 protein [Pitta sordida]
PEAPDVDPDVKMSRNGWRPLAVDSDPDVEEEARADPDVGPRRRARKRRKSPGVPDVVAETPSPDVGGRGALAMDSDTDVEGEGPGPDVRPPKRLKTAPKRPRVPDVQAGHPDPDVGAPRRLLVDRWIWGVPRVNLGVPDPSPPPQLRRSRRLARGSRGGGASPDPAPTQNGRDQTPKPRPSPKPRPQRPQSPVRGGAGVTMVVIGGCVLGAWLHSWPRPQEEEAPPAEGATRRLRPRGATGPAHIRVLFTGVVASRALEVALGTLGGTMATSVTDCSHLVTDGVRRTLKFLCAVARGVPIVTPQWLLQSWRSGRVLSPERFLLRDPPRERHFGFRLSPTLARARQRPLLQGYEVHVTPSVRPGPEDMKELVTCCGGTFLPTLPTQHAVRGHWGD